jgi:hypothetical protein
MSVLYEKLLAPTPERPLNFQGVGACLWGSHIGTDHAALYLMLAQNKLAFANFNFTAALHNPTGKSLATVEHLVEQYRCCRAHRSMWRPQHSQVTCASYDYLWTSGATGGNGWILASLDL